MIIHLEYLEHLVLSDELLCLEVVVISHFNKDFIFHLLIKTDSS